MKTAYIGSDTNLIRYQIRSGGGGAGPRQDTQRKNGRLSTPLADNICCKSSRCGVLGNRREARVVERGGAHSAFGRGRFLAGASSSLPASGLKCCRNERPKRALPCSRQGGFCSATQRNDAPGARPYQRVVERGHSCQRFQACDAPRRLVRLGSVHWSMRRSCKRAGVRLCSDLRHL
eukprot:scaffold1789_cov375-Prasinococcus_capsulatus_cf.AAC.18